VLRVCKRVLKPGARMGLYTIHLSPGLAAGNRTRGVLAGPRAVDSSASYPELLARVGFVDVRATDATAEFLVITKRMLEVSLQLERRLRKVQGDSLFEEFQRDREGVVAAVEDGILQRSFILASAPAMRSSRK
jgi:hypothetical protein